MSDALADIILTAVDAGLAARAPARPPLDPLAIADRILSGRRGATVVSLDELVALATAVKTAFPTERGED